MSLSPVDIARHEFSKSLRGYDVGEVRGFLEGVASELAELQVKLTQAEEAAAARAVADAAQINAVAMAAESQSIADNAGRLA